MEYRQPNLRLSPQQREELHERLFDDYDRYFSRRCAQSDEEIANRWHRDFSSLEAYEASVEENRNHFRAMLGGWPWGRGELQPEVQRLGEEAAYTIDRVFISSFADVRLDFLLLVPRNLQRPAPAIVAQHGLGTSPEIACGFAEDPVGYHCFGSRLAEQGYLVAAPRMMGPANKRNWLQRKAMLMGENLTGAELFGLSRVLDYLDQLDSADSNRIGMYGLSQGGLAALYLPALDKRIKVTVISGHFYWLMPKMVIPSDEYTAYILTDEEDKFFPGQLLEFSEADIASLICPRYAFIEHGLNDPVPPQQTPEKEYPKIRAIYEKLGIPDRIGIEVHPGGHEVRMHGALEFIRRHL